MIIIHGEDYAERVLQLSAQSDRVDIITYSSWCGILGDGRIWEEKGAHYRGMFTGLKKARVLIGLLMPFPCHPGCEDCEAKWMNNYQRQIHTAKRYKHLDFYLRTGSHVKLAAFYKGKAMTKALVGSRNISDGLEELSFEIDGSPELTKEVERIFKPAVKASECEAVSAGHIRRTKER